MTSLTDIDGSVFAYEFDGEGNRLSQSLNDCLSKRFVYDGADVLLELNPTNGVAYAWVNGPGIDQPIERLLFIDGTPRARRVFHADALGSIAALTDPDGLVTQTYAYSAFGSLRSSVGPDLNRVTYTAREQLGDSHGWMYYRHRIYSPGTGHFVAADPLEFIDGAQQYAYCVNNPMNHSDSFGLATYLYLIGEDRSGVPFDKAAQYLSSQVTLASEDSIVIQHIKGFNDFNDALKNNKDIIRITYLGHGNPGILFISSAPGEDTNITCDGGPHKFGKFSFDSRSVHDLDTSNVRNDAEIYLYSCFSGRSGWSYDSIARSFGIHFNVPAYGGYFGTKFMENGQPYTFPFYLKQGR